MPLCLHHSSPPELHTITVSPIFISSMLSNSCVGSAKTGLIGIQMPCRMIAGAASANAAPFIKPLRDNILFSRLCPPLTNAIDNERNKNNSKRFAPFVRLAVRCHYNIAIAKKPVICGLKNSLIKLMARTPSWHKGQIRLRVWPCGCFDFPLHYGTTGTAV